MEALSTEILVALILLLLALSAVFSSSETAIFCLDRLRLETRRDKGSHTAARLIELMDNPDKTLSLILVCNNVCNIACTALVTLLTQMLFGEAAVAVAVGVLTLVVLIFAELAPKTLAALRPELIAYPIAWVYPAMLKILFPLLIGLRLITTVLLYPLTRWSKPVEDGVSTGELRTLLSSSRVKLPRRRARLMINILDFEKLRVEDVMVPRKEIQAIDLANNWNEVLEQIKMHTFNDILFCEESLDNIKGSCASRSLLDLLIEDRLNADTLTERIVEPIYAIEGTLLTRLIVNFQANPGAHLILVLNEYDSLQGLLTRNDILKRINPNRSNDELSLLRHESDDTYLADAAMHVVALNAALQIKLPTTENLTLNGLVTNHLESIPQRGVVTQIEGVTFEVVKSIRSQVLLLRVKLPSAAPIAGAGGADSDG